MQLACGWECRWARPVWFQQGNLDGGCSTVGLYFSTFIFIHSLPLCSFINYLGVRLNQALLPNGATTFASNQLRKPMGDVTQGLLVYSEIQDISAEANTCDWRDVFNQARRKEGEIKDNRRQQENPDRRYSIFMQATSVTQRALGLTVDVVESTG